MFQNLNHHVSCIAVGKISSKCAAYLSGDGIGNNSNLEQITCTLHSY